MRMSTQNKRETQREREKPTSCQQLARSKFIIQTILPRRDHLEFKVSARL